MVCTELHSHMSLQQRPRFYVPLEFTWYLFVAYYLKFRDREPCSTCWKRILTHNHAQKHREFVLIIVLSFCCHKDEDSDKNRLKRIKRHWIRPCYTKVSGGTFSQYVLWSGSIRHPLCSSMLKNKRFFSLVISKLMLAFSPLLYNFV